jgi:GH15 family glucan-1,4-alpha-glucosidase
MRSFLAAPLLLVGLPALALDPHRSFHRLVTGNGFAVASYDRVSRRIDTFLEHPYRFRTPRNDPVDLCFQADESRDLAYDAYFGVRSGAGTAVRGEWLAELPLEDAGYLPGTGILFADQRAGTGRNLRVRTYTFMPMSLATPALVLLARVDNEGTAATPVSVYALFNFRLGLAGGGREPSPDGEEVSWDTERSAFYEYGPSQGTIAHAALTTIAHATASTGSAGVYSRLLAAQDLDDVRATSGPTSDVAPGFQWPESVLAPGGTVWAAAAVVWALDEDAAPDLDLVRAWTAARAPEALLAAEASAWADWHTPPPAGLDARQEALWKQSAAFLRMAQVHEPGMGFGQILASLPPGPGNPASQWNIAWVRDMAYATAALARTGHLAEARDALAFQVGAGPGRHLLEVGRPYRISVTRYFGDGREESDCNADGPNIEFDGFGLFLWSLGEYVRGGGDLTPVRSWWPTVRDEIADVLVSLVDASGIVRADSSIWEVHWNGKQRRFTYTSLAAARGLCDAAFVATRLGETADAARWAAVGARVRDGVVALHTDGRGVLAQSAEDLATGTSYVDAAAVEALNFGVVDPRGRVASATLDVLLEKLLVPSGMGYMRNDDGGWYDSQEWVFVDLRLAPALQAAGREARAKEIRAWVEGQAFANDLHLSELHDATTGDYAGSIPMAGFGAGAYLLLLSGGVLPAACGAYAPEPAPADAGAPPPDAGATPDAGPTPSRPDAGTVPAPVPAPRSGCASAGAAAGASGALAALALCAMGSRRRRRSFR